MIFDIYQRMRAKGTSWAGTSINRCVAALASESLDAPGCHVSFSLEPILSDLEGVRYVGLILPASLADLLHKTGSRGGDGGGDGNGDGSGSDGGTISNKRKTSTTGGGKVQVR